MEKIYSRIVETESLLSVSRNIALSSQEVYDEGKRAEEEGQVLKTCHLTEPLSQSTNKAGLVSKEWRTTAAKNIDKDFRGVT